MCQKITGKLETLNERWAWKVFSNEKLYPYMYTLKGGCAERGSPYERGKWYKSTGVKEWGGVTNGGFHVFKTKRGVMNYNRFDYIAKVRIRGEALPFKNEGHLGWAVHEMMIPEAE